MDIGKRLKAYRLYMKMSQEALSSKAGVNVKHYGQIERGETCPTIDSIEKICNGLNIDIAELFLFDYSKESRAFALNQPVVNAIIQGLKNDIDIHFNRDIILNGCQNSIWYSGYVGSMCFDEFVLSIHAVGNTKGILVKDYNVVLELNSNNAANELRKYISDDEELLALIEYMPYDESVVRERNGNVLFLLESNWLVAHLTDCSKREVVQEDIILDSDNIIEVMTKKDAFFDYIFGPQSMGTRTED